MIPKFSESLSSLLPKLSNLHQPLLTFVKSVAITSVAVTSLILAARQVGILEPMELGAFDSMVRAKPDEGADPRLLIVAITEGDIQRLKEWPISDRAITQVLQKLNQLQPQAIGLDLFRDVPLGDGRPQLTKLLQTSDRIIGICKANDSTGDNPGTPPPPGLSINQVGFVDFSVDRGGILRRALLFMKPPASTGKSSPPEPHLCNDSSQVIFSFGLQLALQYLQTQGIQPENAPDGSLKLGTTVFTPLKSNDGGYSHADDRGYQLLINYRSPRDVAKQVNLTDVLEGKLDPNLVKDRIVLIGYTTDTVKDEFYTPYSAGKQNDQAMPGVMTHAQVVSQILSTVLDHRSLFWFWPESGEILWIWGWSLVGGTLAWRISHPLRFAIAGGVAFLSCGVFSFGLFLLGGWIPTAASALALVATAGSVLLIDRFNQGGYAKVIRDRVKQVFRVEIDQEKKEQQVAEITQSEFFKELQQKKDELRNQRRNRTATATSQLPSESETTSEEVQPNKDESDDYLAQLQQKAKQQKQRRSEGPPASESPEQPTTEPNPADDFGDLQAKAKLMKQRRSTQKQPDRE